MLKSGIKICLLLVCCLLAPICLAETNEIVLPLHFSQGIPATYITVQGKRIPLLFDTGSSRTNIVLNQNIVKKLRVLPSKKQRCFHDDTGKRTCLKTFIVPKLKIGNFTIHRACPNCEKAYKYSGYEVK